jgi:hypothetical protein
MVTRILFVFMALSLFLTGCADKQIVKIDSLPPPPPPPQVKLEQQLVKEIVLRADNSQESVREFFYSVDGILQEKLFTAAGSLRETSEYIYENNLLVEHRTYGQTGKLTGKKTYTYTPGNLPQTESFYNERDALIMISYFSYDDSGRRTEWRTMDAKDTIMAFSHYTYEDGRLTETLLAGANGIATMKISVGYDREGRKILETYTNIADELEKKTAFVYDDKSRLVSQETLSRSRIFLGKTVYEYSGDRNEPEKIYYFGENEKPIGTIIKEFA